MFITVVVKHCRRAVPPASNEAITCGPHYPVFHHKHCAQSWDLLWTTPHRQRQRKMLHVTSINGRHCLSLSGRGITPFLALKPWPLQCAKGAHGYGLPRVPNAIGAIDRTNAGLQRKERLRNGAREKEEMKRELQECVPGEPVFGWGRASGMLPRRAAWRLG